MATKTDFNARYRKNILRVLLNPKRCQLYFLITSTLLKLVEIGFSCCLKQTSCMLLLLLLPSIGSSPQIFDKPFIPDLYSEYNLYHLVIPDDQKFFSD